jgi:hypothetical protein
MKTLEETYKDEVDIINELKYFLQLSRSFSAILDKSDLYACREFYRAKRRLLLRDNERLASERINQMRFGIMDSIRIVTFEIVSMIRLDKQRALQEKLNEDQMM